MLLTEGRAGDHKAIVRVSHVQEEAGMLGTSGGVEIMRVGRAKDTRS